MPIISLFRFPSPNWDFWKGKKNNNNKQRKNSTYTVWKGKI